MESKEIWDRIAPSWDEYKKKTFEDIKGFLKENKGNVLDLGCGSGRHLLNVKGQKLFAVDFSDEMIKLAKGNAKERGIKAEFSVMKAEKLSFEDNFFDAILFIAVLHCIDSDKKRKDTLKEIYRTLKPGGRVFISAWGRNSQRIKNRPKEAMMPWRVEGFKQMRYTYIYDLEELKEDVEKSGLKIEKVWEGKNINCFATSVS